MNDLAQDPDAGSVEAGGAPASPPPSPKSSPPAKPRAYGSHQLRPAPAAACTHNAAPLSPTRRSDHCRRALPAPAAASAAIKLNKPSAARKDSALDASAAQGKSGAKTPGAAHASGGALAASTSGAATMSTTTTTTAAAAEADADDEVRKKRDYDKWTQKEEESFFGVLKAKGNDFQKITTRVNSKNLYQVKCYYYRLLKKINKVLSPLGVQVDPKDNSEVHAAMLSWWGMQGKLGASTNLQKLAQRPKKRRLFASGLRDTLERHRKRAAKRREAQVETSSVSGNDDRLAPQEGAATAENLGSGEAGVAVGLRDHQATETGASAAASQGTRATTGEPDKACESAARRTHTAASSAITATAPAASAAPDLAATSIFSAGSQGGSQASEKLMLQLVPLDEDTKALMTRAGLCPHLELTFRPKKSLKSIMQHLLTKWGSVHELLPASASPETELQLFAATLAGGMQSWGTSYASTTAAAMHRAVGGTHPFRLKFAWLPPPPASRSSIQGGANLSPCASAGTVDTSRPIDSAVSAFDLSQPHQARSAQPAPLPSLAEASGDPSDAEDVAGRATAGSARRLASGAEAGTPPDADTSRATNPASLYAPPLESSTPGVPRHRLDPRGVVPMYTVVAPEPLPCDSPEAGLEGARGNTASSARLGGGDADVAHAHRQHQHQHTPSPPCRANAAPPGGQLSPRWSRLLSNITAPSARNDASEMIADLECHDMSLLGVDDFSLTGFDALDHWPRAGSTHSDASKPGSALGLDRSHDIDLRQWGSLDMPTHSLEASPRLDAHRSFAPPTPEEEEEEEDDIAKAMSILDAVPSGSTMDIFGIFGDGEVAAPDLPSNFADAFAVQPTHKHSLCAALAPTLTPSASPDAHSASQTLQRSSSNPVPKCKRRGVRVLPTDTATQLAAHSVCPEASRSKRNLSAGPRKPGPSPSSAPGAVASSAVSGSSPPPIKAPVPSISHTVAAARMERSRSTPVCVSAKSKAAGAQACKRKRASLTCSLNSVEATTAKQARQHQQGPPASTERAFAKLFGHLDRSSKPAPAADSVGLVAGSKTNVAATAGGDRAQQEGQLSIAQGGTEPTTSTILTSQHATHEHAVRSTGTDRCATVLSAVLPSGEDWSTGAHDVPEGAFQSPHLSQCTGRSSQRCSAPGSLSKLLPSDAANSEASTPEQDRPSPDVNPTTRTIPGSSCGKEPCDGHPVKGVLHQGGCNSSKIASVSEGTGSKKKRSSSDSAHSRENIMAQTNAALAVALGL